MLYARVIDESRWKKISPEGLDGIGGEAITVDLRCKGNELSVFQVDGPEPTKDEIEKIATNCFSKSFNSIRLNLTLLFLTKEDIKSLGLSLKSEPLERAALSKGIVHRNLVTINFKAIKGLAQIIYDRVNTNSSANPSLVYPIKKSEMAHVLLNQEGFFRQCCAELNTSQKKALQKYYESKKMLSTENLKLYNLLSKLS